MLFNKRTSRNNERFTSFIAREDDELFNFIFKKMGSMSKTAVKSILTKGEVFVNDLIQTKYNFPVHIGDTVKIEFTKSSTGLRSSKLSVLYEDENIIVINKSEGLLSVETDKKEEVTAFRILLNHLKKQNKNNRLYVVHRLDRETSGVLLFAKQKETQMILQENWQRDVLEKSYVALVEGIVEKDKDTILTWLTEEPKSKKVYSDNFDNGGQKAITHYEVIKRFRNNTLLKVILETGRKNQIRVHMQCIGHPIVGDKKYGGGLSPVGRIGLHAAVLSLRHPITGKIMRFEAPVPEKIINFK